MGLKGFRIVISTRLRQRGSEGLWRGGLSIFIVEVKNKRDSRLIGESVARHRRELLENRIYEGGGQCLRQSNMAARLTNL